MIKFLLKSIFFLLPFSLFAQWETKPSNTTNALHDVIFTTRDTGFIVGEQGEMLMTSDGGLSWEKIDIPTFDLFTIHFPSKNTGYTNGLKTTNGGITWDTMNEITQYINAIYFINDSVGIYAGGLNGKTTDGGLTWSSMQNPGITMTLEKIEFITDSIGFMVGWYIGGLYKTIDQGSSWSSAIIEEDLFSIKFPSPDTGYAVGWHGVIVKTVDSGDTWLRLNSELAQGSILYELYCLNNNICYSVGANGTIIKTIDGGQQWSPENSGTSEQLNSIYCVDSFCIAVGYNGIILRTNLPTGITPIDTNEERASVFPNPVNDQLTIKIHFNNVHSFQFDLYNVSGQLIKTSKLTEKNNFLDLSSYAGGIYFYKVTNGGNIIKQGKIVKQ